MLENIDEERISEVMPTLRSLQLGDGNGPVGSVGSIERFLTLRQLSGNPVAIDTPSTHHRHARVIRGEGLVMVSPSSSVHHYLIELDRKVLTISCSSIQFLYRIVHLRQFHCQISIACFATDCHTREQVYFSSLTRIISVRFATSEGLPYSLRLHIA